MSNNTNDVIINDAAMDQVVIPMIKSFIAALESKQSKAEIKKQVEELLASAQAASDKMATDKKTAPAGSHYASHSSPKSHIHIVV